MLLRMKVQFFMRDSHLNSGFILSFLSFPPTSACFSMSKYVKIGEK